MRSALVPPVLDLTVDRYAAWTSWKKKWEDYALITGLTTKDPKYQSAMIRYTFNTETGNIFETLKLSTEDSEKPDKIIEALEKFAWGIINETLERHTFNVRQQEEGELFDDFLTDIKMMSKNCNFCADCYNVLIQDRIVGGIRSDNIRNKLLSEKDVTLEKTIDIYVELAKKLAKGCDC